MIQSSYKGVFRMIIALFLCLQASTSVLAHDDAIYHFTFSEDLKEAYRSVLDLRLVEAQQQLDAIKEIDPENALVYHIENYIDFFTLIITEEKDVFDRLVDNKDKRLDKIRKGDKSSPYYRFSQSEIYLQWALVRAKFEQKLRAFNELSAAYNLLEENIKKHPDFIINNKSMGVLHALIGTIPDKYKWGVKLISGMEGTISQGIQEIEDILITTTPEHNLFYEETTVLYAFLALHLQNAPDNAWQVIQEADLDVARSPLATFVVANVAFRSGRNAIAIKTLEQRPTGAQYLDFYYLDYLMGVAKLRALDPSAGIHIETFLTHFNGRHYIKEAWQKLAWNNYIHFGEKKYRKAMKQCLYSGYTVLDEDKYAMREARSGDIPNVDLLQVRLLTDGAYYDRALSLLDNIDIGYETEDYLELLYRRARINQFQKEWTEAISTFDHILTTWPDHPSYMVANSALQLGIIYEHQNEKSQAERYYTICLEKDPEQYKSGIQQKAKAGLIRITSAQ